MNVPRLLRTVRHLTPTQMLGQVRVRLRKAVENPKSLRDATASEYPGVRWKPLGPFQPPCFGDVSDGTFTFVGRSETLGLPPKTWTPDAPLLWLYNLHYHEWLWGLRGRGSPRSPLKMALDWTERHPLARGAVGWAPYPTSLRLMNWCALFFADEPAAELWPSVWRQAQRLTQTLETHLLGNHLLENAAALACVGVCFDGAAAAGWRRIGFDLLRAQLAEQILPDGVHFERSPMYHARVLYVLGFLANTGDGDLRGIVEPYLPRMRHAAAALTHPDGRIALFNDAAFDIYPDPPTVAEPGVIVLPDAGYYTARNAAGDYVVCDFGPLGPDHLPGHAHADMLSFEASFGGKRFVVDGGTFDYVDGRMRAYCRSVVAHNTVQIDGKDQAEFWGAFRVGRRAKPTDWNAVSHENGFTLTAGHTAYDHRRTFDWRDGTLAITDHVGGAGVSRLHLHPEVRVEHDDDALRLVRDDIVVRLTCAGALPVIETMPYCPRFGVKLDAPVLVWRVCGGHRFTLQRDAARRPLR